MSTVLETIWEGGLLPVIRAKDPVRAALEAALWQQHGVPAIVCPVAVIEAVREACPALIIGAEASCASGAFALRYRAGVLAVVDGEEFFPAAYAGAPSEIARLAGNRCLACVDSIGVNDAAAVRWIDALMDLRFAHLGVNSADAREDSHSLTRLLGVPAKDGETSVMCGPFELMKAGGRGIHGHVGFTTPNVPRTLRFLLARGFSPDWTSARYDDQGKLYFVYFEQAIAGFAFHIMRRE